MSNIEELEKLADLKKKGIISKEEFEEQKERLLKGNVSSARNTSEEPTSPKSRAIYAVLAFFFGWLGIHNFYLGRAIQGIFQLLPVTLCVTLFIMLGPESGLSAVMGGVSLLWIFIVCPFWLGLNLLCTRRDGAGRLMDKKGNGTCITFGIIEMLFPMFIMPGCMAVTGMIIDYVTVSPY